MKPSDIKVGKTYCNRGKGLTMRRVIDIYNNSLTSFVKFMAIDITGNQLSTYSDLCKLSTFAKWAGSEMNDDTRTA